MFLICFYINLPFLYKAIESMWFETVFVPLMMLMLAAGLITRETFTFLIHNL